MENVQANLWVSTPCQEYLLEWHLFLQLPDASSYTGHSMRRSSATLLANAGGDLMAIKRHGGWKSSNVAESNVAMNHTSETSCESSIPATVEVNLSSPIKQKKNNNVLSISVNINVNLNK
jgi:hypothetical protein